ncbi:MAG: hypothetical protein P8R42_14455 [Candidatus Binatia bacterium]|nr:hypothetical protein [Candidatus Binatia bacterium]
MVTTRIDAVLAALSMFVLCAPLCSHAHLMVEQRDTINIVEGGAFVVLSVPVAAFTGVDDDDDGRLSRAEFASHYRDISAQVEERLELTNDAGRRPLQGLLINPGDDHAGEPSTHLVVMGRFKLDSAEDALHLRTSLFGRTDSERTLQVAATRGDDSAILPLTPDHPKRRRTGTLVSLAVFV